MDEQTWDVDDASTVATRVTHLGSETRTTLDTADETMERNDTTKEKLYDTHNKCVEITTSLKPEKLVEMVAQTRQIEDIIKNLINVVRVKIVITNF